MPDVHSTPQKFLLVDDDPDFINYFALQAEPYNLTFDICKNLQEARQKIQSDIYNAYIVDLNLPDGSGMDLIQEIRSKEGIKNPIAIISGVFHDAQMLKSLKDKYSIDYILDKPIFPQQIDKLLVNLCHRDPVNMVNASHAEDDLIKEYVKTIGDKIGLLTELVKSVQANPSTDSLTALKNSVHKIAGSAGTYGFLDVSKICKDMEFQITRQLSSNAIEKEWVNSLDEFLRNVKFSFQFSDTNQDNRVSVSPATLLRPSLYVIDSDVKFLELLQREKEEFSIDLFVESNPEKALSRLKSTEFNPRIIVISQTFFGSKLNAFDLLEVVQKKPGSALTIFAIILEKESIDDRINAIKKGFKYIFHKPLSAHVLLKSMAEALEVRSLKNFKVLVLDDDSDICNYISSVLSEVGVEVKAIENPLFLYQSLDAYSPNLLFLDLILPTYEGFDLLKTLRADIIYKNLIIVIITARTEDSTLLSSFLWHADGILYKPLDKKVLQRCVLHLGQRTALLGLSAGPNRIGLEGYDRLVEKIREITVAGSSSAFLVLFRIDRYPELVFQKGKDVVNEFEVSISNMLQRVQDNTISCFFFNGPTFSIVFTGYDERIVEKKTFDLLSSVQQQSNLKANFSCSILSISKNLGTSREIIQTAENALQEANNKESTPIKIVTVLPQDMPIIKKKLMVIEPNKELLQILKTSFEAQDITVIPFSEGHPALQELLSYSEAQLPDLIIAERKLPDMDGLEILKSLNMRFKVGTPLYFLTDFAAEKDISEGLKYGALEYITKPFSLALLVQKSMKVIFEWK